MTNDHTRKVAELLQGQRFGFLTTRTPDGTLTSRPMTLQVGQRIEAVIEDIAFGGEGVARVGDFVVFIPFVLTQELIEAELTEVKTCTRKFPVSATINRSFAES